MEDMETLLEILGSPRGFWWFVGFLGMGAGLGAALGAVLWSYRWREAPPSRLLVWLPVGEWALLYPLAALWADFHPISLALLYIVLPFAFGYGFWGLLWQITRQDHLVDLHEGLAARHPWIATLWLVLSAPWLTRRDLSRMSRRLIDLDRVRTHLLLRRVPLGLAQQFDLLEPQLRATAYQKDFRVHRIFRRLSDNPDHIKRLLTHLLEVGNREALAQLSRRDLEPFLLSDDNRLRELALRASAYSQRLQQA